MEHPQHPPDLETTAPVCFPPSPPWPAKGNTTESKSLTKRKRHLLTEPAPEISSSAFLHGSAPEELGNDRQVACQTTRSEELEPPALLTEMPELRLPASRSSCHQSPAAKKTRRGTYQIWPARSSSLLPHARKDELHQNLDLKPTLLRPTPRPSHLRTASPPGKASVWLEAEEATLKPESLL